MKHMKRQNVILKALRDRACGMVAFYIQHKYTIYFITISVCKYQ